MFLWQQTRSLPESNTDAELKGGSEMVFSITMINVFSLVRAFSFPVMSPSLSLSLSLDPSCSFIAEKLLCSPPGQKQKMEKRFLRFRLESHKIKSTVSIKAKKANSGKQKFP